MTQDNNKEVHYKRLRWRCRRGMLELDLFLQHFFAHHFLQLPESEKVVFEQLLDYSDPKLFALLMGHRQADDEETNNLAQKIRNAAHS